MFTLFCPSPVHTYSCRIISPNLRAVRSVSTYSSLSYTVLESDDIISTFYFVILVKVFQRGTVFPDKMVYDIASIFETKFLATAHKTSLTVFIFLFDVCTTYTLPYVGPSLLSVYSSRRFRTCVYVGTFTLQYPRLFAAFGVHDTYLFPP